MHTEQISPSVFRLSLRFPLPCNCYLVREGDGFTLVDTSIPNKADDILAAAQALGGEIKRVIITHDHGDHVGSLSALLETHPEIELITSARTAQLMRGEHAPLPNEPQGKLRGQVMTLDVTPSRVVEDGEQVGGLQVVNSPGHTPDHIALYQAADGVLLAGDAFVVQGGLSVSGVFRWRFPFPALATWDKPTAVGSARRLLTLKPRFLAAGHGPVLENPVTQMTKAVEEAARKYGENTLAHT